MSSNLSEASEITGIITNSLLICGSLVAAWNWKSIIQIFVRIAQGRASTDEIADARDRLAASQPLRDATHQVERLLHATGRDAQARNLELVDRLARDHRGGDIESLSRDPSPELRRGEDAERRNGGVDTESFSIRIDSLERFGSPQRQTQTQRYNVGTQTQSPGTAYARSKSAPHARRGEGLVELTARPAPGFNRIQDGPGGARLKERPGQASPRSARDGNGDMPGPSATANRMQRGPATGIRGLPSHKGGRSGKAGPWGKVNRSALQPES